MKELPSKTVECHSLRALKQHKFSSAWPEGVELWPLIVPSGARRPRSEQTWGSPVNMLLEEAGRCSGADGRTGRGSPPSWLGCCAPPRPRTAPGPVAAPRRPAPAPALAEPPRAPAGPPPPGARPPAPVWIPSLNRIQSSWLIVLQAKKTEGAITQCNYLPQARKLGCHTWKGCREPWYKGWKKRPSRAPSSDTHLTDDSLNYPKDGCPEWVKMNI